MVSVGIREPIFRRLFIRLRIFKFKLLSGVPTIEGRPLLNQPVLFLGTGTIRFGNRVNLGYAPSPFLYSGYVHLEARSKKSKIIVDDDVWINNDCSIISDGEGIYIGARSLIGPRVQILDSDFHEINPDRRMSGEPTTAEVRIGENVFVGSDSVILKGVSIGKDSVIGHSSVVVQSIPEGVIAAGNPCRVLRRL